MKNWRHLFSGVLCLTLVLVSGQATADQLTVKQPWIQEGPPVARVLAAFMTLVNDADHEVILKQVSNPDFGAVEMHLSKEVDGMARMFPQKQLSIPAKGQLVLKHGSYHLMLFNPKKVLKAGDSSQFTFHYGDGSQQTLTVPVKKNTGGMHMH